MALPKTKKPLNAPTGLVATVVAEPAEPPAPPESKPAKVRTPKPLAIVPADATPAPTKAPQADILATRRTEGELSIKADVLTYGSDHHRARIHLKSPTGAYYKLAPGGRFPTKASALSAALAYRDEIFRTGTIPPRGTPAVKRAMSPAPSPTTTKTPKPSKASAKAVKTMPGVTRVLVD